VKAAAVYSLQIPSVADVEPIMSTFQLAFIQGIGGPELLIILVIILLLFGAKKLPELAKGLGKSMKEFKKAAQEVQEDFQEAMDSNEPAKKTPPPAKSDTAVASEPVKPDESKGTDA
jgi:sec-independent protein translocase protein TatA